MVVARKAIRRQMPKYKHNPSVVKATQNPKIGRQRVSKDGTQCLVLPTGGSEAVQPETGELAEIVPAGTPAYLHRIVEKDTEEFVKIFPSFIKAVESLSGPADKVFKLVYAQVLANQDVDIITLYHDDDTPMSKATFERGVTELLEKEVLFKTVYPAQYYINVNYMFNGNRLAIVTEYRRKGDWEQGRLPI